MIKCIAIYDETFALKKLVTYIKKIPYLELVAQCRSAIEAQRVIDEQEVEAIFLDINMPDLNGLDFAKSMQDHSKGPVMVFTTAYSEYAIEGYKANGVGYLLKPYSFDEFEDAVLKVKEICEIRQQAMTEVTAQSDDDGIIFVKSDYKSVLIAIEHITHTEARSEYLRITWDDKQRPVIVLLSMKKIEEHLPSNQFMRIHRSFIINLKKISEIKKNHVVIEGDISLPIGDNYKDAFMNYLNSKILTK